MTLVPESSIVWSPEHPQNGSHPRPGENRLRPYSAIAWGNSASGCRHGLRGLWRRTCTRYGFRWERCSSENWVSVAGSFQLSDGNWLWMWVLSCCKRNPGGIPGTTQSLLGLRTGWLKWIAVKSSQRTGRWNNAFKCRVSAYLALSCCFYLNLVSLWYCWQLHWWSPCTRIWQWISSWWNWVAHRKSLGSLSSKLYRIAVQNTSPGSTLVCVHAVADDWSKLFEATRSHNGLWLKLSLCFLRCGQVDVMPNK